jgi:hypothetical protein
VRNYKIILGLLAALLLPVAASANSAARGWCEIGAQTVTTSGLTSTTQVQASYPGCSITVIIHGGGAATIYSDNANTPLANPFTSTLSGQWTFFAANGRYDITLSGGGLPSSVTYSDVVLFDAASVGGVLTSAGSPAANQVTYFTSASQVTGTPTDTTPTHALFTTAGAPAFRQPTLTDIAGGTAPAGTYNFSGVTLIQLRVGTTLTTSTNGDVGYDTTNKNWHGFANGVDSLFATIPTAAGVANEDCADWDNVAGAISLADVGAPCVSLGLPNTWTSAQTFSAAMNANAGGTLNGTFGGPTTLTGVYATTNTGTHSGTETFTGALNSNNLAAGNVANKPVSADSARYVSAAGNDSNDGLSMGTAKATISGAYSSLANCSNIRFNDGGAGQQYTAPCGTIYVAESTSGYTISTTLAVSGPFVRVIGLGEHPTVLNCATGATPCVTWTANTTGGVAYSSDFGFANITFNGNNTAGSSGLNCVDCVGVTLDHLRFANFSGAGSKGLRLVALNFYMEETQLNNIYFDNDTCQLSMEGTGALANSSFGHQWWSHLEFTLGNGQTAVCASGNAQMYSSFVQGVINTNGPNTNTYTGVALSGTAKIDGMFNLIIDNAGLGTMTPTTGATASNFQVWGWAPSNNQQAPTTWDLPTVWNVSTPAAVNSPTWALNNVNKWQAFLDGSNNWSLFDAVNSKETVDFRPNVGEQDLLEGTCGGGFTTQDTFCADSTAHVMKLTNNGGPLAPVAQNPPPVAGATDLGSTSLPFGNVWLGTAGTNNFKLQPASTTGARVITLADPLSPTTVAMPLTIANGTAAMTTAGIAAGACGTTVTVAATGVLTTDTIDVSHNAAATNGNGGNLILNWWPTAGNVNFNYCNPSAGIVTPTAMTVNWSVRRP